jgi:hypothetical protein
MAQHFLFVRGGSLAQPRQGHADVRAWRGERVRPPEMAADRWQTGVSPLRLPDLLWKAAFVHGDMDLDALDLLSAVDASVETARRRAAGSAVDNHGARFRSIPTSAPPVAVQPAEQPPPEAEPGPAGEQSIKRAAGDAAQQSDPLVWLFHRLRRRNLGQPRPPLHAAEVDAPDRHPGLPQLRPGQWRLWPRSHRPGTVLRHGFEFRPHCVNEHIDIGKRIPRARRRPCWADGSSPIVWPRCDW